MGISNNTESVILNNCKNNVINIVCKNKVSTVVEDRIYRHRVVVTKHHFVTAWMHNYKNGLEAVAAALDMTLRTTWQRYCEYVTNGINLPRAVGHNPYEFGSNEVAQLNRTIRNIVSGR
jgi:hypothetical protein